MTDKFHFMPDKFHFMTEPTLVVVAGRCCEGLDE